MGACWSTLTPMAESAPEPPVRRTFISWSGKPGAELATTLHSWLGGVLQNAQPWVSTQNIEPGSEWNDAIKEALANAEAAIVIVNRDALKSSFVMFESGWLSSKLKRGFFLYLVGMSTSDVPLVLSFRQMVEATKEGTFDLLLALNDVLAERVGAPRVPKETLSRVMDAMWPDLEKAIAKAIEDAKDPTEPEQELRSDRDILEEILSHVRRPRKRHDDRPAGLPSPGRKYTSLRHALYENLMDLENSLRWGGLSEATKKLDLTGLVSFLDLSESDRSAIMKRIRRDPDEARPFVAAALQRRLAVPPGLPFEPPWQGEFEEPPPEED